MISLVIKAIGIVFIIYLYRRTFRRDDSPSLPPGPKPIPIVGNIRDLPPPGKPEYQHWLKFKDTYGPISAITVFGTPLIIIHDHHAAHELLEKNSIKTSGRPNFYFGNELCGFGQLLPTLPYDATFRQHRKLIHQELGTKAIVRRYHDIQDVESRRFLLRILDDPNNAISHIKTEASAIILKIVYGYSVNAREPDPLVALIEGMMDNFSRALVPKSWMVDIMPILNYLPKGFPGASFKETASQWKNTTRKAIEIPYAFVRQQMQSETHRPSYVSSLLGNSARDCSGDEKSSQTREEAIMRTAAILYGGGADTTVSTLSSFLLAMTLFPAVQQKAQEEIDTVVGLNRLPGMDDRSRLPYVEALVKESLRWLPVVPIDTTHVADEEILYAGFRIPKGSYLLPSIWWFLHDPQTYRNPSCFNPERFLEPRNEPDPANEAFGYGRRICPGRFLADDSLFLTISRLLASFSIEKPMGGQDIKRETSTSVEATPGLISHPAKFPYKIRPRNAKAVDLIRSVEVEHPWEGPDADLLIGVEV